MADPDWEDPLDGTYAEVSGGRWNSPGSFPVVYLNRDRETARANADKKIVGQPFTFDDLRPERRPVLVSTQMGRARYFDVVTDRGCQAAGLPITYPLDAAGHEIPHEVCRPIGTAAHAEGEAGVACRSAAPSAPPDGEELAWFQREARLQAGERESFEIWYWGGS